MKARPIRSISRALAVLRAINQGGSMSMMQIAKSVKLPYATVNRIVQTLIIEELIEQEPSRKKYRPTILVKSLAYGYQDHSRLVAAGRAHIVAFTQNNGWPALISTRIGPSMIVRDCTHCLTSLTFNYYYPGFTFPLVSSATGLSYLAFTDEAERAEIIGRVRSSKVGEVASQLSLLVRGKLLSKIRSQGYAIRRGDASKPAQHRDSSIAVPIMENGVVSGVLSIVFFDSSMSISDAVNRYLPDLVATARSIGDSLKKA
jgi:IclR family transcriptional regulator, mhp operon transcriptional activator